MNKKWAKKKYVNGDKSTTKAKGANIAYQNAQYEHFEDSCFLTC